MSSERLYSILPVPQARSAFRSCFASTPGTSPRGAGAAWSLQEAVSTLPSATISHCHPPSGSGASGSSFPGVPVLTFLFQETPPSCAGC